MPGPPAPYSYPRWAGKQAAPASRRFHIETETFVGDTVLPNRLGQRWKPLSRFGLFPLVRDRAICQAAASHPGARPHRTLREILLEWVPRLLARLCQRSGVAGDARGREGQRAGTSACLAALWAWEAARMGSCGCIWELPVASVSGEDAGFGCLLCGRVPLPWLLTRRIKQIGESKAIASW